MKLLDSDKIAEEIHLIDPLFWNSIPERDEQIARLDLQAHAAQTAMPAILQGRRSAGDCSSIQAERLPTFQARTHITP